MSVTTFRSHPRDVSLCSEVGSLMMTPMSLLVVVTSMSSSTQPGGATRCNIPKAQLPKFVPPSFGFRPIGRTGRPSLTSATIGGAPQRIPELTLSRFTELRLQKFAAKHPHTCARTCRPSWLRCFHEAQILGLVIIQKSAWLSRFKKSHFLATALCFTSWPLHFRNPTKKWPGLTSLRMS